MRALWGIAAIAATLLVACSGNDEVVTTFVTRAAEATLTPLPGQDVLTPAPTRPGRVPTASRTPAARATRPVAAVRSTGCGQATTRGDSIGSLETTEGTRSYRLHIPPGYNRRNAMPLVLNFHGYAQDAAQQEAYSGLAPLADQKNFILVTPEGSGEPQGWDILAVYNENGIDDILFVRDLVESLSGELCIDQRRIFATGHSNGAEMASEIACYLPTLVAAVAPVSGAIFQDCEGGPVPMIAFQGTEDWNVPYEDSAAGVEEWAAYNQCAGTPTSTTISDHVTRQSWTPCAGNDVIFYIIDGGGHTWPGAKIAGGVGPTTREIDASQLMWQFFSQHPKR